MKVRDLLEVGLGSPVIQELANVFQIILTQDPGPEGSDLGVLLLGQNMVADLGEQSYLATAFQGCFEIAEENIENFRFPCPQR